jgi:hypothetical protein
MLTINQERRLRRIKRLLDDVSQAVNYAGYQIVEFVSKEEDVETELFDAETLLKLVDRQLFHLYKSVDRKLKNARPRKPRRAEVARLRLVKKDEQKAKESVV